MRLTLALALVFPAVASATEMNFLIDGAAAQGHTLAIVPVEGGQADSIDAVGFRTEGLTGLFIGAQYVETSDGRSSESIDMEPADGTTAYELSDGVAYVGSKCITSGYQGMSDAIYYGGGKIRGLCGNFDADAVGGGDTDSDGVCDAGDADRAADGQGDVCDEYDDDACAERVSGGSEVTDTDSDGVCDAYAVDGGFVFGQTVYGETRVGKDSDAFSSTIYGQPGKRIVSTDFGARECHVGVFDDDGLVYATRAPCAEIGAVSSSDGDADNEIPQDQHIAIVSHAERQEYVTQVIWTWDGGAIDVSYHLPGEGWIE